MSANYDIVIIGAGPGGYSAALEAIKHNLKTAIIEHHQLGGTCLNYGCIPTKSLLQYSRLYYNMRHCDNFGLHADNVSCDCSNILKYAYNVKSSLRNGMELKLKKSGVDIIHGKGFVDSPHTVTVSLSNGKTDILFAKNIVLATGSRAVVPQIAGINRCNIFTADQLLSCDSFNFNSISIIGGGVIGVEFATVFSELGIKTEIIESTSNILSGFDIDVSRNAKMILKKHGVQVHVDRKVEEVINLDDSLCCILDNGEKICSDAILVAVGRIANIDNLFANTLNIKTNNSKIYVESNFRTSVSSIYAIGDLIDGPQLAHAASAQGISCIRRICGLNQGIDLSVVPSCIYTHPEAACVGLNAEQAKSKGIPVKTAKSLSSSNGRSMISNSERGFIKLIFNSETDEIIGACLMCENASDMIGEFSSAISNKLKFNQIQRAIRPHPSYNEMIFDALSEYSQ